MPPVPENRAVPADQPRVNDYDVLAEAYTAENETSLINAYYARPAMLALAGDVAGRRILDAGCGSGPLFAALRDRGATVTGFDSSPGMLEQARRRLGDGADLRVAELGRPLPFPDGAFDDVIAALVLHYLEDWGPALAELRRVLKPGGRLIVAVDHPFAIHGLQRQAGRKADYFATYNWTEDWIMGGQTVPMSFWTRPLHAMTDAFTAAGFRISVISEPHPVPEARELFPDELADMPSFLCFLFFVLHAANCGSVLPGTLTVDLPAVAGVYDRDHQPVIADHVQDSVLSGDPDPQDPARSAPRPAALCWLAFDTGFMSEPAQDVPVSSPAIERAVDLPLVRRSRAGRVLPDVPVVVFSATTGRSQEQRETWTGLHAKLAASVPQGTHIVLADTSHATNQERPAEIAEAVNRIIAAIRERT